MSNAETERKKILQVYFVFGAALAVSVAPFMLAAIASLVFFTSVLIAAYVIRSDTEDDSLTYNHMSFVIRTIWIGSFLALITVTVGCAYMLYAVDNAPFTPCISAFLNLGMNVPSTNALVSMFQPCIDHFIQVNLTVLIIAGTLCAGPVLLYFILRYIRGIKNALRSAPVPNYKSWG